MTSSTATVLPDHKGEKVTHAAIKFTGVGTGFSGLDVRPIVMELDDEAYFVVRVTANESASHRRNNKDELVRLQRVKAEDMAPISRELAQKVLQEYAEEIERAKSQIEGQMMLEAEQEAEARERADRAATGASPVPKTDGRKDDDKVARPDFTAPKK